jgi:hypothetical protein
MDVKELNALRRRLKRVWDAKGDRPTALIHLADEDGDREAVGAAFRTLSSEMGLRYLRFDLASGLTDEHETQLARRGPRLVVITSVDGVDPDARPGLEERVRAGARTLPVCVIFLPAEQIRTILEAEARRIELKERHARMDALIAEDDARRAREGSDELP